MLFLKLFLIFTKIGTFNFGGGYAMLSLIHNETVVKNHWLSNAEFTDIVAISQSTPGPIGINCATYVGYTATGSVWGSLLATFAIILPSLIIMLSICRLYFFLSTRFRTNPYFKNTLRMLRFAVIGLIAAAALLLITPDSFIDWKSWLFFAVVFILTILPELTKGIKNKGVQQLLSSLSHPILLIILAGIAGYVVYN